jgi:hypothetical protein
MLYIYNGGLQLAAKSRAGGSETSSTVVSGLQPYFMGDIYFHMQKTSGGVWSAYYSLNGMTWIRVVANINSGANPTVGYITLYMDAIGGTASWQGAFDWIRVNWLTLP